MNYDLTELCIELIRYSTRKQGITGTPEEDQTQLIQTAKDRTSLQFCCNLKTVRTFEFAESSNVEFELQPFLEAAEFCKEYNQNLKNEQKIKFAFFKSIDRSVRKGSIVYGQLKAEFAKAGVLLVDAYGVIGTQTINTLEHLGVSEYEWSKFNPTWINELLTAERAKDEVRDILSRLIGAEIRYVRKGYSVGPAHVGLMNIKIMTESDGKRVVEIPDNTSNYSRWIKEIFELTASGNYTDEEITKKLNDDGFKTPIVYLHDKEDPKKIVGQKGGITLDVEQMRRFRQNPIYAGVNVEKWTAPENHSRKK